MTNFEKLKQELTVEELAKMMDMNSEVFEKIQQKVCNDNDAHFDEDYDCHKGMKCIDCIKEWLNKPVATNNAEALKESILMEIATEKEKAKEAIRIHQMAEKKAVDEFIMFFYGKVSALKNIEYIIREMEV